MCACAPVRAPERVRGCACAPERGLVVDRGRVRGRACPRVPARVTRGRACPGACERAGGGVRGRTRAGTDAPGATGGNAAFGVSIYPFRVVTPNYGDPLGASGGQQGSPPMTLGTYWLDTPPFALGCLRIDDCPLGPVSGPPEQTCLGRALMPNGDIPPQGPPRDPAGLRGPTGDCGGPVAVGCHQLPYDALGATRGLWGHSQVP